MHPKQSLCSTVVGIAVTITSVATYADAHDPSGLLLYYDELLGYLQLIAIDVNQAQSRQRYDNPDSRHLCQSCQSGVTQSFVLTRNICRLF
jgi:hypothetical protein